MTMYMRSLLATAASLAALQASATTITFEDLTAGTTLSNQYAALGVTFTPNAFTGAGASTSGADWATTTDMTIVSSSGGPTSVGGLGTPLLVSGNVLHAIGDSVAATNWYGEDGDPSFRVSFASAVSTFSADFAGVFTAADVRLFVYDGSTLLNIVAGTSANAQFTLSYAAPSITSVVITPGSFDDWVGVDNISFTAAVPEPETYALMGLGLGVVALARRRAKSAA